MHKELDEACATCCEQMKVLSKCWEPPHYGICTHDNLLATMASCINRNKYHIITYAVCYESFRNIDQFLKIK